MKFKLRVWRQENEKAKGDFKEYDVDEVSSDSSFLEMLDVLNEQLVERNEEPIAFDHDCREGICGACSLMINGDPHGPQKATTTCQLHMRSFNDGDKITVEPWRAKSFPVVKDLVVDRTAFDRIIQSGGYVSVRTGSAIDGNAIPVSKPIADMAMDAAACIGCGACVAACPNSSAMLFTAAKVSQLNRLPQGKAEKDRRVLNMVATMDNEGFGNCSNYGLCQSACPKEITLTEIAKLNRDFAVASAKKFLGWGDLGHDEV